jgi:hypothetical protein
MSKETVVVFERLRKTTKSLSQDTRLSGRDEKRYRLRQLAGPRRQRYSRLKVCAQESMSDSIFRNVNISNLL